MMTYRGDGHYQNKTFSMFCDGEEGVEVRWYHAPWWEPLVWYDDETPPRRIGRAFKHTVTDALWALII